jgi:LemA protein
MKWAVGIIAALLLLGLILGTSACGSYNSLTTKRNEVQNAFSNVDTLLQRRADLVPNLVNTVKGYAQHEEKVFGEIAEARSRLLNAKTVDEKSQANDQLTGALGRLLAISENYPNLKADQGFLRLQDELAGTENRISVGRQDYNKKVLEFNNMHDRFPTVIFANLLGFPRAEEFKASESSRQVPNVDFGK